MTMRLTATLFTPIPGGIEVKTDSLKMWDTLDGLCTTNPEDCQNIYNGDRQRGIHGQQEIPTHGQRPGTVQAESRNEIFCDRRRKDAEL